LGGSFVLKKRRKGRVFYQECMDYLIVKIISLNFALCFKLEYQKEYYMKTKFFRSLVLLAALSLTAVSFSSCNRGYGCPTNFSIGTVVGTTVSVLADAVED
jgi:hypothetical protein